MKKRLASLFLTAVIALSFTAPVHTFGDFDPDTVIMVNGNIVKLDKPVFFDDTGLETYLPARTFFENIGYKIIYDSSKKTIHGSNDTINFSITIGSDSFTVNNQIYEESISPSKVINSTAYISDFTVSKIINSSVVHYIRNVENIIEFINHGASDSEYDFNTNHYISNSDVSILTFMLIANLKDFDDDSIKEAKEIIFNFYTSKNYAYLTENSKSAGAQIIEKKQNIKKEYAEKITDLFKRNDRLIYSETSTENSTRFMTNFFPFIKNETAIELITLVYHLSGSLNTETYQEAKEIYLDVLSFLADGYINSYNSGDIGQTKEIEIKLNKIIEKIKTFMTEHDITEFDYSEYTKTLKELLKDHSENPKTNAVPYEISLKFINSMFNSFSSQKEIDEITNEMKIYIEDLNRTAAAKDENPILDKSGFISAERELSNIYMRIKKVLPESSEHTQFMNEISDYVKGLLLNSQRLNTQEKIDTAEKKLKKYIDELKILAEKNKIKIEIFY
jgi:hypothetical protein